MFAPRVSRAQTSSITAANGELTSQRRALPAAARTRSGSSEQSDVGVPEASFVSGRAPRSLGWDFGKCTVGRSDDPVEHEADRIADTVLNPSGPVPDPIANRRAADAVVGASTSIVRRAIGSPGRSLDAQTRSFFESRFGNSFGHVRVYTDAAAAASARSLGADAYTLGSEIVFGSGQYSPQTANGRRLLAHELAHVMQTGTTAQPGAVVRRKVTTLGGDWDTDKYRVIKHGARKEGVEIDLRFTPQPPVNATLIGLVQTANSVENGARLALNPTVAGRSIPAGQPGAGVHMDQLARTTNPLYAADPDSKAPGLAGAPTVPDFGQHGWLYQDAAGATKRQDAILKDDPNLSGHGSNSSQTFETAAVAIQGAQTGTFYGSVRWGWHSDAHNNFSMEPLSVVSVGVPTDVFKQATTLWNASKTSDGDDVVPLPVAAGSTNALLPSAMTDIQIAVRLNQIATELAGETRQTLEFERQALEREQRFRKMGDFPQPRKNRSTAIG